MTTAGEEDINNRTVEQLTLIFFQTLTLKDCVGLVRSCKALKVLRLKFCPITEFPELSDEELRDFCHSLRSLTTLEIMSGFPDSRGRFLRQILRNNTHLKTMKLDSDKFHFVDAPADVFSTALRANGALETLDINHCGLTNAHVQGLLHGLEKNKCLESISIAGFDRLSDAISIQNRLDETTSRKLQTSLASNKTIVHLSLKRFVIEKHFMARLGASLQGGRCYIRSLELIEIVQKGPRRSTRQTAAGLLFGGLRGNSCLKSLVLGQSYETSDYFGNNSVTRFNFKECESPSYIGEDSIYQISQHLPHLLHLATLKFFWCDEVSDRACEAFASALQKNGSLEHLELFGNTPAAVELMASACTARNRARAIADCAEIATALWPKILRALAAINSTAIMMTLQSTASAIPWPSTKTK